MAKRNSGHGIIYDTNYQLHQLRPVLRTKGKEMALKEQHKFKRTKTGARSFNADFLVDSFLKK